jgi:FixJ family two-component response regulator
VTILLLDDDDDLREALGELFMSQGAQCVAVGSLEDLERRGASALACEVAILDVNLGPGKPSGVDAYRWLRSHAFAGRIVFLTGHARTHPSVAEAYKLGTKVLEKPVSTDVLMSLLRPEAAPESLSR